MLGKAKRDERGPALWSQSVSQKVLQKEYNKWLLLRCLSAGCCFVNRWIRSPTSVSTEKRCLGKWLFFCGNGHTGLLGAPLESVYQQQATPWSWVMRAASLC